MKKQHHHIRLNLEFHSDLCWRQIFLAEWNGLSLFRWDDQDWIPDHFIQIEVSGAWGCGSFGKGHWFQWAWPPEWANTNIMVKELVQIVFSCAVWGKLLSGRRELFECDNSSVVAAVNKHYTKEPESMWLLRCLWFLWPTLTLM